MLWRRPGCLEVRFWEITPAKRAGVRESTWSCSAAGLGRATRGSSVAILFLSTPAAAPLTYELAPEVASLGALLDPSDRAIVATARVHRLRLQTADQRIIQSQLVQVPESSFPSYPCSFVFIRGPSCFGIHTPSITSNSFIQRAPPPSNPPEFLTPPRTLIAEANRVSSTAVHHISPTSPSFEVGSLTPIKGPGRRRARRGTLRLPATSPATWSPDHILCYPRNMKDRVLSASEFKARCLACLGEIEQSGEPITITRRGRPVAVLGPAKHGARKSPRNTWARRGRIGGDIVNPDMSALWEAAAL